ncbi:MAG: hypothetical protein ACYCZN_10015 [Candidatus Dormibacteria bacterium]
MSTTVPPFVVSPVVKAYVPDPETAPSTHNTAEGTAANSSELPRVTPGANVTLPVVSVSHNPIVVMLPEHGVAAVGIKVIEAGAPDPSLMVYGASNVIESKELAGVPPEVS